MRKRVGRVLSGAMLFAVRRRHEDRCRIQNHSLARRAGIFLRFSIQAHSLARLRVELVFAVTSLFVLSPIQRVSPLADRDTLAGTRRRMAVRFANFWTTDETASTTPSTDLPTGSLRKPIGPGEGYPEKMRPDQSHSAGLACLFRSIHASLLIYLPAVKR